MSQDVGLTVPNNENQQFAQAAIKWLYEMQALHSPTLMNHLYGNIYSFPGVKDAEILVDAPNQKMLILIQFSWLLRKVFKSRRKETILRVLDQLQELLPSFEFRVIEDRALFDKALQGMRGLYVENPNASSDFTGNELPNNGNKVEQNSMQSSSVDARTDSGTGSSSSNQKE